MDIKFTLYENHFKQDSVEYMGRVMHNGCCTHEKLIDEIVNRRVGIARSEIIAVLEEYQDAVTDALSQGKQISTPMFTAQLSIKGKFARHNERFNPKKHKVIINLNTGKKLKAFATRLKGKRISKKHPAPFIGKVEDFASKTYNEQLTPGGICKIKGMNLKVDPAHPEQGIFLISGPTEIQVEEIIDNKPSQVIFTLPRKLSPAEWRISVKAISGNSTVVRDHTFHKPLQVTQAI